MAELADVQLKNKDGTLIWKIYVDDNDNIVFEHVPSKTPRFWLDKDGVIHRGESPTQPSR